MFSHFGMALSLHCWVHVCRRFNAAQSLGSAGRPAARRAVARASWTAAACARSSAICRCWTTQTTKTAPTPASRRNVMTTSRRNVMTWQPNDARWPESLGAPSAGALARPCDASEERDQQTLAWQRDACLVVDEVFCTSSDRWQPAQTNVNLSTFNYSFVLVLLQLFECLSLECENLCGALQLVIKLETIDLNKKVNFWNSTEFFFVAIPFFCFWNFLVLSTFLFNCWILNNNKEETSDFIFWQKNVFFLLVSFWIFCCFCSGLFDFVF